LRIAQKGYKIKYAPEAIAVEASSASIEDELKRKVRIAAGSLQTIPRLLPLLNPFLHGFFSIQYWSHKILRWVFVPLALIILIPINIFLAIDSSSELYGLILVLQIVFYFTAFLGYLIRKQNIKHRFIFAPYYLLLMNLAIVLGFIKHLKGKQSVNWEKARRQLN
jgi:cellulose synthase/poly-beta-1,6-N-acetylglucosamine synthase-like glycosyltransferase